VPVVGHQIPQDQLGNPGRSQRQVVRAARTGSAAAEFGSKV
jgi:hypothetical protein